MNKQQSGFTLIELVVVIVILGILAATALPKFVSLNDDAKKAKAQAVAGSISAYSAMKYSQFLAQGTAGTYSGAAACSASSLSGDVTCTGYVMSGTSCVVTCDSQTATAYVDYPN